MFQEVFPWMSAMLVYKNESVNQNERTFVVKENDASLLCFKCKPLHSIPDKRTVLRIWNNKQKQPTKVTLIYHYGVSKLNVSLL